MTFSRTQVASHLCRFCCPTSSFQPLFFPELPNSGTQSEFLYSYPLTICPPPIKSRIIELDLTWILLSFPLTTDLLTMGFTIYTVFHLVWKKIQPRPHNRDSSAQGRPGTDTVMKPKTEHGMSDWIQAKLCHVNVWNLVGWLHKLQWQSTEASIYVRHILMWANKCRFWGQAYNLPGFASISYILGYSIAYSTVYNICIEQICLRTKCRQDYS